MVAFFPHVYADQSGNARFGHALFNHHAYLRVFATEGLGFEKWVLLLGLLTDITTNMFLLAVFYNLQYPDDNGSCKLNKTETECLRLRSPFDEAKHMCGWQQSSVYKGSTAPPYQCVWLKPKFEFKTLVEISMIVSFVAVPIYYVTGHIREEILLATTHDAANQQAEVMQERRRSVQLFLGAADASNAARQKERQNKLVHTFSTLHTVDETLFKSQIAVRRTMTTNRLLSKQGINGNDGEQKTQKFDSAEELFRDLQGHAAVMNHRIRDQFLEQWPIDDDAARKALSKELEDVKKWSAEWISTLKAASQATVGVRLLQLFVQDLIGRSSHQSRIFANQLGVDQISKKRVVTWATKCLAFTALCCLNCFFVYMCMLYGRSKGLQWQKGWLIASCVNLMVDIMINQITVAVVVYYLIPNTIFDTTRMVKAIINHAVATLSNKVQGQKSAVVGAATTTTTTTTTTTAALERSFSATDYLFVSTRVAKAFPDSVESAVILAYRSQVIAQQQSERWTKAQAHRVKRSRVWTSPLAAMGLVATYFILSLGSQSLSVQELLDYAVNPALFGAALRIGFVVSSRPYVAFPVGTAAVFGCAVALYYLKKVTDKRSLSLRMEGFMRKRGGGLRRGVRPGQVMPLNSHAKTTWQGPNTAECRAQSQPAERTSVREENDRQQVDAADDYIDDLSYFDSDIDSAELLYDMNFHSESIHRECTAVPQANHSGDQRSETSSAVRWITAADILGDDWASEGSDEGAEEFDDEWMYNYFIYGAAGADSRRIGVEAINDDRIRDNANDHRGGGGGGDGGGGSIGGCGDDLDNAADHGDNSRISLSDQFSCADDDGCSYADDGIVRLSIDDLSLPPSVDSNDDADAPSLNSSHGDSRSH